MIIYTDTFTGSEMFSDVFPTKVVDDVIYEVNAAKINISSAVNVNIGANPSAEEQEEALDENVQTEFDVVYNHGLKPVSPFSDAKEYFDLFLKKYIQKLTTKMKERNTPEEEIKKFKENAAGFYKKIKKNYKDYEFYTGANDEMTENGYQGMIVLLNYREDGITPYFSFWKHGLDEVKS